MFFGPIVELLVFGIAEDAVGGVVFRVSGHEDGWKDWAVVLVEIETGGLNFPRRLEFGVSALIRDQLEGPNLQPISFPETNVVFVFWSLRAGLKFEILIFFFIRMGYLDRVTCFSPWHDSTTQFIPRQAA